MSAGQTPRPSTRARQPLTVPTLVLSALVISSVSVVAARPQRGRHETRSHILTAYNAAANTPVEPLALLDPSGGAAIPQGPPSPRSPPAPSRSRRSCETRSRTTPSAATALPESLRRRCPRPTSPRLRASGSCAARAMRRARSPMALGRPIRDSRWGPTSVTQCSGMRSRCSRRREWRWCSRAGDSIPTRGRACAEVRTP